MKKYIIPALIFVFGVSMITSHDSLSAKKKKKLDIVEVLEMTAFSDDFVYNLSDGGNSLAKIDPATLKVIAVRSLGVEGDAVVVVNNIPLVKSIIKNRGLLIQSFDPDTLEPMSTQTYAITETKGIEQSSDLISPGADCKYRGPAVSSEAEACPIGIAECVDIYQTTCSGGEPEPSGEGFFVCVDINCWTS